VNRIVQRRKQRLEFNERNDQLVTVGHWARDLRDLWVCKVSSQSPTSTLLPQFYAPHWHFHRFQNATALCHKATLLYVRGSFLSHLTTLFHAANWQQNPKFNTANTKAHHCSRRSSTRLILKTRSSRPNGSECRGGKDPPSDSSSLNVLY
jgi:hypothetical protein